MKLIFTTVILASTLTGCAVTTAVNVISYAATGKGLGDHVASAITSSDCDGVKTITHDTYYCEHSRDPAMTYNRNTY
jgi:hypothetical protein